MLKTEKQKNKKIFQPVSASRYSVAHRFLLVRFQNLLHNILTNENSTLETNVSHFGVLHWHQWYPTAYATGNIFLMNPGIFYLIFVSLYSITDIKSHITNKKMVHLSLKSSFFNVIDCKVFEMFPKRNESGFVLKSFNFN